MFGLITLLPTDILLTHLLIYLLYHMVKVLQATSRGQITLPKNWRDNFDTNYYKVEIQKEKLIIVPLKAEKSFKDSVEQAWAEYGDGKFVSHEDLKKQYGL